MQGRGPRQSSAVADDRRDALLSQVAFRYYEGHETQEEIAQAIGRSIATVSRLLTRAEDAGVVEMDVTQPHPLVPALQAALVNRFDSRDDNSFAMRVLAALRNEFGGHAVRPA